MKYFLIAFFVMTIASASFAGEFHDDYEHTKDNDDWHPSPPTEKPVKRPKKTKIVYIHSGSGTGMVLETKGQCVWRKCEYDSYNDAIFWKPCGGVQRKTELHAASKRACIAYLGY